MLTLTKGFKKPENGDRGSVFFPAIADDIQQLNDHNHQGSNSQLLSASASTAVTQDIATAAWTAAGGGVYTANVTISGTNITFDTHKISARLSTDSGSTYPDEISPTIVRLSSSSFSIKVGAIDVTSATNKVRVFYT